MATATTTVDRRRPRRADGAVPIALLAGVLLAAAVVLPTTLRPPPDPANQSAQFSPDAPPDDQQDAIVAALNRASSGTAGTGQSQAGDTAVIPKPAPPRSCAHGRGNPPRQVESLYSAPCAPVFIGDNGGATYQGVTANEIRIAVTGTNAGASDPCQKGRFADPPPPGECDSDRTFRVFAKYFNDNFQFYGRRMVLYGTAATTSLEADVQKAAVTGADEYKVFANEFSYSPGCQEYTRRKLISICPQLPRDEYERWKPYMWDFYMDGTEMIDYTVEYWCKKLVGKPATHAGDAALTRLPRKFGVIYFSSRSYASIGPYVQGQMKSKCNTDIEAIAANPDDQNGQASLATAISRFKIDNVTTVLPFMDAVSMITLTNIAESNGYFPEWFADGAGAATANAIAELMNQHQWGHAFGLTPHEAERKNEYHDCYRAYKSEDPGGTPNYTVCKALFYAMLLLADGIQAAGPHLTPQTFADGLYRIGERYYDKPHWALGGGFSPRPGGQNYGHNAALVWYSPTTQDPQYLNSEGAWIYELDAKRYRHGEFDAVDRAFVQDPTAVPTPTDAGQYDGP